MFHKHSTQRSPFRIQLLITEIIETSDNFPELICSFVIKVTNVLR